MSDLQPGDWLAERFAEAAGRLPPPGPAPAGELLRRGRRRRARRRAIAAGSMAGAAAVILAAVMTLPSRGHSKLEVTAGPAARSSGSAAASGSSSGDRSGAASSPTAPAVSAPPPTMVTVTTAPAVTTTTAAPPGSAPCRSAQLAISEQSLAPGQYLYAALGHSAVVILFKNTAGAPCTLSGYPAATGVDASGAQVARAARTPSGYMGGLPAGDTTAPAVILAPGETASAMVEGTDNPSGAATTCPALSGLLVTAPGTPPSVRLPAAPADCSGLEVHPVVAGTSGSQHG